MLAGDLNFKHNDGSGWMYDEQQVFVAGWQAAPTEACADSDNVFTHVCDAIPTVPPTSYLLPIHIIFCVAVAYRIVLVAHNG